MSARTSTVNASRPVAISTCGVTLPGVLTIPTGVLGVVIFAHGTGSSHRSLRNLRVAGTLNDAGFATLLFDLLTAEEGAFRPNVFDVPLLAERLGTVTQWLARQAECRDAPIGYFGASTGAAAALWAAASNPQIAAIVSRGGRPDLAEARLAEVRAPTLLIVGGRDSGVLELNEIALEHLAGLAELRVVAGATHLFEEPGALDAVADLARDWFARHLVSRPQLSQTVR